MAKITWLHFTDLHQGLSEQEWSFPNVFDEFCKDLKDLHEKVNQIDLILFTGDLTQGHKTRELQRKQFEGLNATLQDLKDCLAELGSHPKLVVVPGNHDLLRIDENLAVATALEDWHSKEKISKVFWSDANNEYRKAVELAFAEYQEWLKSPSIPLLDYNKGLLPGDFSATFEKDGIKLGVVGLNSAFLQLTDRNYKGELDLHIQQIQQKPSENEPPACHPNLAKWIEKHDVSILMTHHPDDWLSEKAKSHFNENIYTPGRFLFHAFGHMHDPKEIRFSIAGAKPKIFLQGASLFGREYFNSKNGKTEKRIHGYSLGSISIEGGQGSLEVWPRIATKALAGNYRFDRDTRFELDSSSGSYKEPFKLKKK